MIHLFTGSGGGKTTSALGVALRASGHNQRVIMIQFLKGRKDIGEYKIQKKLKNYKVYQFGTKSFVRKITDKDKRLAEKGLKFILKVIKQKPKILILDEINLALKMKLLNLKETIKILKRIPKSIHVILTGRYAPKELIKISDLATKVEDIKRVNRKAEKGIEY